MSNRISNVVGGIKTKLIRLVLTLAGALFVALATIVLLAPNSVREFIEGIPLIIRLLALFTIYLIAGVIVYQEFVLGGRNTVKGLIVRGNDGAVTSIETQLVQDQVISALEAIRDIEPTFVRVKENRGKAVIAVTVNVKDRNLKLPDKEREIIRTLRQVVEKQLGVRIDGRPTVTMTLANDVKRTEQTVSQQPRNVEISESSANEINAVSGDEKATDVAEGSEEDRAFWDFLKSTSESDTDDNVQA